MKPQATDQAVLTTLQNVPGVGQKKAVALLSKFNSRYFLASCYNKNFRTGFLLICAI